MNLIVVFFFPAEWDLIVLSASLWGALSNGWTEKTWLGPRPGLLKYPAPRGTVILETNGHVLTLILIYLINVWLSLLSVCLTCNMELDRRLLLAHCAAHALSIAAGLLVVVPMALNGSAFKGRCALFSNGYWRTEDREELTGQPGEVSHLVVQEWGPPAACQFATFVGIFTVLYGAAQSWRSLFYLHGRHDEWVDTDNRLHFCYTLVNLSCS